MKTCEKCDNKLSDDAIKCPKCGTSTNLGKKRDATYPCRICQQPVLIRGHFYSSYNFSKTISDGNTNISGHWRYDYKYPCPHCGEPEPLKYPLAPGTWRHKFVLHGYIYTLLIISGTILFALFFLVLAIMSRNDPRDHDGPALWICFIVSCIATGVFSFVLYKIRIKRKACKPLETLFFDAIKE